MARRNSTPARDRNRSSANTEADDIGEAQRERKDALPPKPRRPGLSVDRHPGRASLARARTRARVEAQARTAIGRREMEELVGCEIDFDDPEWVDREVERRLEELAEYAHPNTAEHVHKLRPKHCSTRPADANDLIEAAAMRQTPYLRVLEELLAGRALGRPSVRKLMVAMFVALGFTGRPKTIKSLYQDFMCKNELLDWAFDYPVGDGTHARAYNSITTALGRQLDHHDPELLVELNGELLRRRRAELGPEYGRRVVLDGTKWETHLLQQKGYSAVENELLKRNFTRAEFGYHGPGEGWRGFTLLVLRDLHSLDILGWMLVPANAREHAAVEALFLRVFAHFPEWRPEVLVADREYDVTALYIDLMERFGVDLICPLRDTLDPGYMHAQTEGVPECSKHGLMTRAREREFPRLDDRERLGLKLGERASIDRARTDWKCDRCAARDTTYFKVNPRIFGRHPRRGEHKLVAEREALQLLRNVAESTNASLQHYGFGLKRQLRAKWVSSDSQAEWLGGAGLFAMNLRKLIHRPGGPYSQMRLLAEQEGLLKPRRATPGALRVLPGGASTAAAANQGIGQTARRAA